MSVLFVGMFIKPNLNLCSIPVLFLRSSPFLERSWILSFPLGPSPSFLPRGFRLEVSLPLGTGTHYSLYLQHLAAHSLPGLFLLTSEGSDQCHYSRKPSLTLPASLTSCTSKIKALITPCYCIACLMICLPQDCE